MAVSNFKQWMIFCPFSAHTKNLTLKIHLFRLICFILMPQPNAEAFRFWWKNEENRLADDVGFVAPFPRMDKFTIPIAMLLLHIFQLGLILSSTRSHFYFSMRSQDVRLSTVVHGKNMIYHPLFFWGDFQGQYSSSLANPLVCGWKNYSMSRKITQPPQ